MCGIVAIAQLAGGSPVNTRELLNVRDAMRNRGPDDAGYWTSDQGNCGLGHRRLSIIDLSDAGHQPMWFADERYGLVYNGELYNYQDLRRQLEVAGHRFQTQSDSEVIGEALIQWGHEALEKFRGMFALAWWDTKRQALLLARDPYGIKPLYYGHANGTFYAASQVRALVPHTTLSDAPDPNAVNAFLNWGHIPEPLTIYASVRELPAGTYLECYSSESEPRAPKTYGRDLFDPAAPAHQQPIAADIRNSVAAHMVADTPVGVFLSAGVDSTLMAWQMTQLGHKPTAVTMHFDEFAGSGREELTTASNTAKSLGLKHHIETVSRRDFLDNLDTIIAAMDQPSIDGINTWLVARAAKRAGLKTIISGVGGDELFAGYDSFRDIPRWLTYARRTQRIPGAQSVMGPLTNWSVKTARKWSRLQDHIPVKLSGALSVPATIAGMYLLRRGLFLPHETDDLILELGNTLGFDPQSANYQPIQTAEATIRDPDNPGYATVAALESQLYMRNQLLRDSDWAGMAHSLEIRTPLVDAQLNHELFPKLCRIDNVNKELLKTANNEAVLGPVLDRPKSGFFTPIDQWIRDAGVIEEPRYPGSASRDWALYVLKRWFAV